MADKFLKSGVGNSFFVDGFFSGGLSHSLSASTPLTISPSQGKRIVINKLAASAAIDNTSVSCGGRLVIDSLRLSSSSASVGAGSFLISNGESDSNSVANSAGARGEISAGIGEDVVIYTTTASSTNISYSFTESD